MIRPFDLRDVRLVARLDEHGIALDSRAALIQARQPLRDAMAAYLLAGRGAPTCVLRLRQPGATLRAFGQVRICSGHPRAQLLTLASRPEGHESLIWPHLLDALTVQAGRFGAHAVLAQVKDNGLGFEALRRSEFVVYTRQEIWRLTIPLAQPDKMQLRPEEPGDQWHIQQLIANTVPHLIQQIEPVDQTGLGLVWMEDGNPLAYVCAHRGPHGFWLQLYLHPEVDEAAHAIIQQAAAHYAPSSKAPLYCCIRRFQEWLNRPLVDLGFESLGSQAVMVRHTTARIAEPEHARVPVHETGLEATSPIVRGSMKREV